MYEALHVKLDWAHVVGIIAGMALMHRVIEFVVLLCGGAEWI